MFSVKYCYIPLILTAHKAVNFCTVNQCVTHVSIRFVDNYLYRAT